tara:strand:+ start:223 stop:423 length:201 start_codon:yes stop_codon:yes gene_type:complete
MDFKNKVIISFNNVKRDMILFKQNIHDWINFLHEKNQKLESRIELLERKIKSLETEKETKQEIIIE